MQNEKQTNSNDNSTTFAFCDCCGNQNTAAAETLISDGWHLGRNEQFCPACND